MPQFTFLSADRPLAKSYNLDEHGTLTKESYPHAAEFTSEIKTCETLDALSGALKSASNVGACLLKGSVSRPLVSESRAGTTDANALTSWVCLDFDRLYGGMTMDLALMQMGLGHVSHIIQYSASKGIELTKGDTGHAFFLLASPLHPAALKQWLTGLNLKTEFLRSQIELTKTNNALSWPLDITTCQNDKLLYLAPPILGPGINGYTGDRIRLVRGATEYLVPGNLYIPSAEENRVSIQKTLDALRSAKGLPERKWVSRVDKSSGLEVLAKPDQATLSQVKKERGFTYFNLNGGDSWGYYHHDDAPEVIRNFKGEPYYSTKELLPEYWAQMQRSSDKGTEDSEAPVVLVFRDFDSATYHNGLWYPKTQKLELARAASELQLQHFLLENHRPKVESIPVWRKVFDPRSDLRVDLARKQINAFEPTIYMRQAVADPEVRLDMCPLIKRVVEHAVSREVATLDHFYNWLTCIFKLRMRTQTSWVLHGIQGTGKGLLLNKVLIPLLGIGNVAVRRMAELDDQFNGYMEYSQLVVIDEAEISESRSSRSVMATLKNVITEPQLSVRNMHVAPRNVENFCNFMFFSNRPAPVQIEPTDRRHNVGVFQGERLDITEEEIKTIEHELATFATYLISRTANAQQARTVLATADRAEMMAASTNSIETTAQALLAGNLEFFWDTLPSGDSGVVGPEQAALHESYYNLLRRALREASQHLTRDELRVIFAYNIGDVPRTPTKFLSMLRHHRVTPVSIQRDERTVKGFIVDWKTPPGWAQQRLQEIEKRCLPLR